MLNKLTESTDIVSAFEEILTKVYCEECKGFIGLKNKDDDDQCGLDRYTFPTFKSREQGAAKLCKNKNKKNDCEQFEEK